jgi:hypothetical protein
VVLLKIPKTKYPNITFLQIIMDLPKILDSENLSWGVPQITTVDLCIWLTPEFLIWKI